MRCRSSGCGLGWLPVSDVADGELAAGRAIDVPLLIGWNSFDGSSLRSSHAELIARMPPSVLSIYSGESQTQEGLAYGLWTDLHAAAPARWIAKKTAGGDPRTSTTSPTCLPLSAARSVGAAHATELPYVFDNWQKSAPGFEITDDARAATKRVHSCWVSFASSAKPSCDGAPSGLAIGRKTIKSWSLDLPRKCAGTFEKHNSMRKKPRAKRSRCLTAGARAIVKDGFSATWRVDAQTDVTALFLSSLSA